MGVRHITELACSLLAKAHRDLGQQDKATEYTERAIKSIKNAGSRKLPRSIAFMSLASSFASEGGDMQQACGISCKGIRHFERELERLCEEYKLSVGNMHIIDFYETHCRFLIELGRDVDALFAAERGRSRVLGELLTKKYAIQEKFEPLNENSLSTLIDNLTKEQILVFMASTSIDKKIFFWLITNEEGPKLVRFYRNKSFKSSIQDLLEATVLGNFRLLADGRDIKCEDRSLSVFYDSESTADDEEIKVNVKRLVESDEPENEVTNGLYELYNMLVAPFADRIEGREVALVPEGSMFMVPFSALQDDKGKYMSEKCRIRIIPSLTTLKLIKDSAADHHRQIGDPLIVGEPNVSRVRPRLCQLSGAKQEAKEIAKLLNVSPLLGEQATKEEVLRRITDVCLIHIAAHGDAERGEIACTPNPSSPRVPSKEDFMLTMEDVAKVGIRAKLVVLSCCHRCRGKIMKAEGVVGIARAFIASGARSVLVSLWLLDDKSTKEFMIRFYGHLVRDKLSASEALHQSMKWMRESKKYSVSDWAPFVLIGDDVRLDL